MTTSEPTAVLHTLPDLTVGGGQVLLLRTLCAMPEGTAHLVWTLAGGPMLTAYRDAGIEVVVASGRPGVSTVRSCTRLVRERGIELVHTNHTPTDRIVGQLAGLLARVPVVNTFHGVAPTRGRFDPARRVNQVLAHTNIAHFVAVSPAVADSYRTALRLRPDRLTVVPPGLPPEAFVPASTEAVAETRRSIGSVDGDRLLAVVGRLAAGKGQALVLDMFERLLPEAPSARLLVVGDGPERADLEERARRLGVADRVDFLGHRDDVPALLSMVEVVLSGSESEGFPLNVLEATASGRPVVAAGLPAFDGFLRHGENALIVPHRADELAGAVRRILQDAELARRLGEAGRATAASFTAAATAERLLDVYRLVLEGRRNG